MMIEQESNEAVLRLWLVSRPGGCSYDEFDSFVVASCSEELARKCHPEGFKMDPETELGWVEGSGELVSGFHGWVEPEYVEALKVQMVGFASSEVSEGEIVLASFNAG